MRSSTRTRLHSPLTMRADDFIAGDARWILDRVQADFRGVTYRGRGFLRWEPRIGFAIEGAVERVWGQHPPRMTIGEPLFAEPGHLHTVRMQLQGGDRALLFTHRPLERTLGLVFAKDLS